MNKKFIFGALLTIIIGFISIYFIKPLFNKINYGLDLQGGFEVLYEISPLEEGSEITSDMVYNTYHAILKRIDILGVSEPVITIEGDNRIRVKLAGITDIEGARNTISSTATLSFRDYNDRLLMTSDVLGGLASVTRDESGRPAISLKVKDVDTFYEATKKVKNMTNNLMVIWLDFDENVDSYQKEMRKKELDINKGCGSSSSHCLSAAYVDRAFASDVIIQGNFTKNEANKLIELINSGALPTKMTEISSNTVDASFGENALNKTLLAGAIGIAIVILIMIIIYRFVGLISSVGLILYTFITFLIFYLINGVLTLPSLAAILLGIGMAVDANVIIFERIKENLKIGTNLDASFDIGNKTSFSSIIDANITTIIAAIIMFIFGESSVKGFATMLIISIISTVIVMVYLVRLIIKLFVKSKYFDNKLGLFIGINKKKIVKKKDIVIPYSNLDVVKNRKVYIFIPLILLGIGLVFFFVSGASYGIDFTGGTSITLDEKNIKQVKNILEDNNYEVKSVSEDCIYLNKSLEKDEINKLNSILKDDYNIDASIYVVSRVVKQELVKNAVKSLIYASIGIIIYIAIRFRFNYAISGILALLHDVLFTFLFFAIFKIEINTLFIASILTIIGYSINDTIVTFDVIREFYKKEVKDINDVDTIVNKSIRRTLFRNAMTSITTIAPIIILMIFGAKEILNFDIALLVGFIAGSYSSLFISTLIWNYFEKRRMIKPKKNNDDDEINELMVKGINY